MLQEICDADCIKSRVWRPFHMNTEINKPNLLIKQLKQFSISSTEFICTLKVVHSFVPATLYEQNMFIDIAAFGHWLFNQPIPM